MAKPLNPTLVPRRCKYCKGLFTPRRTQDTGAKFCTPAHRKSFWKNGALPFEKLMLRVEQQTRAIVRDEFAALVRSQQETRANAE